MKPLPLLLIACLCCVTAQNARAQDTPWTPGVFMKQALNSCYDAGEVFLDGSNYGYEDIGISVVGTYMQPYSYYTLTKYFDPGTSYVVIAAGDEDATDVDLRILNTNYETISEDTAVDRIAIVEFTPKAGSDLTIEVELYEATTASFVSFIILRDGGVQIPRSDLNIATNALMDRAAYMNQDLELGSRYLRFNDGAAQACVFGGLIPGGDGAYLTNITVGDGDARLIAEGGPNVQDIDLILYDSNAYELDADRLTDAHPIIDEYTTSYQSYQVEIANHASYDGLPTFCMVGVMQIRP